MSFAYRVLAVTAITIRLAAGQDGQHIVYTMRGEYDVQPQGDGKSYVLRRFAKDGRAYETIAVTKSSEKNGETVYDDGSGKKYTILPDGSLEERIKLDAAPSLPQSAVTQPFGAAPRLMTSPPAVPRTTSNNPAMLSRLTLPTGEAPLRTERGLIFLTTGVEGGGRRHEVVVQKVADRWYIRTSLSNDPNEAPAFTVEEDGTVIAYRQLPPGVPQVGAINRGDEASPLAARVTPPSDSQGTIRRVEYDGHKGRILSFPGKSRSFLFVDNQSGALAVLESVRGSFDLFTLVGREDVFVVVDHQSKLTAADSAGRPVSLWEIEETAIRAAVAASLPPVTPPPALAPSVSAPVSLAGNHQAEELPVEYQGRKGTIFTRTGQGSGHPYLSLEGQPNTVELESVRGGRTLFTPVGRNDIFLIVDPQGKLTVTDSSGQPVSLEGTNSSQAQAAVAPASGESLQTPATQPSMAASYSGPTSGTLECDGSPIPQNGEHVFSGLPPVKLDLVYDKNNWDAFTVEDGRTQRVIIRNKKPGAQKKCTVHWKVIQ